MPITADGASARLRRIVLAVVATGVGAAGAWMTSENVRLLRSLDVATRAFDARALTLLLGPGIAGVGLLFAAMLLVTRRRFALGVYWGAVLVALSVELLSCFGCFDLSTPPGGQTQIVFISPDYDESLLWGMLEKSLLGLLIVVGHWATRSREPEVEGVVADAA